MTAPIHLFDKTLTPSDMVREFVIVGNGVRFVQGRPIGTQFHIVTDALNEVVPITFADEEEEEDESDDDEEEDESDYQPISDSDSEDE